MNQWEKQLPERVRQRLESIEVTPENRKRMKAEAKIKDLLAQFYRGDLDPDDCAQQMKEFRDGPLSFLIPEMQRRVLDSLSLQIPGSVFRRRSRCLLVLERLHRDNEHGRMKAILNQLGELIKYYRSQKEHARKEFLRQVEQDPRLRMARTRTEIGEVSVQLSPEEAMNRSPQFKRFMAQHESQARGQFDELVDQIRSLVK